VTSNDCQSTCVSWCGCVLLHRSITQNASLTFTNKEYDDIYFVYAFWNGNYRAAPTEYQWQYPGCRVTTFQNVYRILRDIGLSPRVNVLEKTMFWMQCSKNHMHYVHRISMWTGTALIWVCRILYTVGFYPYHLQRVLNILLGDHTSCIQFCEWLQAWLQIMPDILFTGDSVNMWRY
jgi:hypothetical protein